MILSVSRRTDIPCYYSEWFMNRLKAGYVMTKNPMNPSQVRRIDLSPQLIDCIVFWTKDPLNIMDKLPQLDAMGYHYYFQFTLTPYGKDIEGNLRGKDEIAETFRQLSLRIGKDKVLWRYDPIILNNEITAEYHRENFEQLCCKLHGYTNTCTISFADIYKKLSRNVKEHILRPIAEEQMHELAAIFSGIGNRYEIKLRACCENVDLSDDGILQASCIDKEIVEQICGHEIMANRDISQRLGCGCYQSVDVGVYNTCRNGCVYCYANHSDASIDKNMSLHNPNSDILIGTID